MPDLTPPLWRILSNVGKQDKYGGAIVTDFVSAGLQELIDRGFVELRGTVRPANAHGPLARLRSARSRELWPGAGHATARITPQGRAVLDNLDGEDQT